MSASIIRIIWAAECRLRHSGNLLVLLAQWTAHHCDTLLRRSPKDPLPSQKTDDGRPPPILVEDDIGEVKKEYIIEKIIGIGTLKGRRMV